MHVSVAILLSFLAIVYASPKHHIVPRQITKHIQNNGFRPTVSSAYNTRVAYEDEDEDDNVEELNEDSSVSSTQIRRPIFAENTYFQNAIPVVQARPQQQQQIVRRPPGPPQQYKPQQFHEVCLCNN